MDTVFEYEIPVWGTVLFISAGSTHLTQRALAAAVEQVTKFVFEVDAVFSTYKADSIISKLRRNEIKIDSCSADVAEVWNACAAATELSGGAFNPWAVSGGFDPSGYVQGWAADRCAQILIGAGCEYIQVNAAGDLTLRGGQSATKPWTVGVVNPDNRGEVLRIFEITDGAIATSGSYERGAHILDPHTGLIAIGAKSATVLGPDGGLTDALATARILDG